MAANSRYRSGVGLLITFTIVLLLYYSCRLGEHERFGRIRYSIVTSGFPIPRDRGHFVQDDGDVDRDSSCVIHTYFQPTQNSTQRERAVVERTISAWKESWAAAGWKPRVISEEDAKSHPQYLELRRKFEALPTVNPKEYEIACFMRHVAMAAVGGGWMSDYNVLPFHMPRCLKPLNDGGFTDYELYVPSLVSGSGSEFTRIANRMADVDYESDPERYTVDGQFHVSDTHVLSQLHKERAFTALNTVVSMEDVFDGKAVCESHNKQEAIPEGFPKVPWVIHYSNGQFESIRTTAVSSPLWPGSSWDAERLRREIDIIRPDFMSDSFKYIQRECRHVDIHSGDNSRNDPCVIYTYFQPMPDTTQQERIEAKKTINTWKESWTAAGWSPRLLSEEDAKSHPLYLELRRKFEALPSINTKEYEMACFMRHVAMAAVGGGWMSDYDVLPFYMPKCLKPLNGGNFTGYQLYVPSFVSGSSSEFTRIAERMASVDYKSDPERYTANGRFHVSDMHVMSQLYNERAYIALNTVVSLEEVFDGTGVCETHGRIEDIPEGFPKLPWVIHYSHAQFRSMRTFANSSSLWPGSSWNAESLRPEVGIIRPDFMADSFKYIQKECNGPDKPSGNTAKKTDIVERNDTCVIYTYFQPMQETSPEVRIEAERTINAWKESWTVAGWKPRVLSEEDAKSHPQYIELRRKFVELPTVNPKEYEMSCFMRHVAMAVVGGGWMSDYDVLPFYMPKCLKPLNGGNFTGYQLYVPAFVSGSSSEFTRIANRMANVDYKSDPERYTVNGKFHVSDMHVMSQLYKESAYIPKNTVISMEEVFDGTDVCESHGRIEDIPEGFPKSPWAIHYSHGQFDRIRTVANKSSLWPGTSWNTERMRQRISFIRPEFMLDSFNYVQKECLGVETRRGDDSKKTEIAERSDTCLIYTYFQPMEDSSREGRIESERTINAWKESWTAAGWKPRVLSEEDAKSHPQYLELRRKFVELPTINPKEYEVSCFMRHVAMAAVGGGWMSDYDVLPFYMPKCLKPLNGGNFTGYQLYVPAFVSGSSSEFTRIANRMANVDYKSDPERYTTDGKFHVSDMHVMSQLYKEIAYIAKNTVVSMEEVFDGTGVCDSHGRIEDIPEGFPTSPWAIHYSHAQFDTIRTVANKSSLWPGTSWNAERLRQEISVIRPEFMLDSFNYIQEECHGVETARGDATRKPEEIQGNNDCVINTYFQPMQGTSPEGRIESERTINAWKESWTAAGWKPRVLSEEDAKSHPQYLELRRKFVELPTINTKEYEVSCFMRHVAMAAVGGGWMSDYDVLPFYMPRCLKPLNGGNFTGYQLYVPAFVSGSSEEFTRIAERMANVDYKSDPERYTDNGRFHVSDMHVMSQLYNERAYIALYTVVSLEEVFDGTDVCDSHGRIEDIPEGFPKLSWAIHYSHAQFENLRRIANTSSLWPGSRWNAERLSRNIGTIRPEFMTESYKYIQRTCHDVNNRTAQVP